VVLPAPERARRAGQLWTLKESYIKARGKGMSLPLDGFSIAFGTTISISIDAALEDRNDRWAFRLLEICGHDVAVCVERGASADPNIHIRELQLPG
jgi:4'-phosphopantetheinyl transferase